jgi:hypothetical protein
MYAHAEGGQGQYGEKHMAKNEIVSARTLRRRKQRQREAETKNAVTVQNSAGPMKFAMRPDGTVEWLRDSNYRWLDRVCAEGKTVAEICDLIGVPRHPTCHGLVYSDGSVP